MANVIVDKNKIDILANAISAKSGEPVTMTLDEMVEAVDGIEVGGGGVTPTGNIDITSAGVTDVTNYATATVASGSATASATKGAVTNHSVTVTPSVTTTAGYVTAGTSSGTAVTVSASELVSGSQTITTNDTYDVTNLASITVSVSGGSGYVWQDGLGNVHLSDDDGIPTLISKSITQDGTYDPATDGADGYSYVTVNVGGGGGISGVAKGTLTVDTDVSTTGHNLITDTTEVGFTPTQFFFWRNEATTANNAICSSTYTTVGTKYCRVKELYSSQDALIRATGYSQSWDISTAGCLYYSNNNIYIDSSSSNILKAGTYTWIAVE